MAKINKLQKSGVTIYPATIPQAVIDSETGKTQKEVNDDVVALSKLVDDASVKIENIVVNGDFRNGLTGWTAGPSVTVLNGIVSIDTASGATLTHGLDIPANNVCYLAVRSQNTNEQVTLRMALRKLDSTNVSNVYTMGRGQGWLNESLLLTTSSNAEQLSTYRAGVGGIIQLDYIVLINLTETFGAGNEPTKEEFESLILGTDYFEGEITIPAQKIMQWQLAMIRQNRNAIIALGGTII